ncbi:hypothetical protein D3C84_771780 [compost metagenome]
MPPPGLSASLTPRAETLRRSPTCRLPPLLSVMLSEPVGSAFRPGTRTTDWSANCSRSIWVRRSTPSSPTLSVTVTMSSVRSTGVPLSLIATV